MLVKVRAFARGYRTVICAMLVAMLGFAQTFDLTTIITGKNSGPLLLGIGLLFAALRALTSTPMFQAWASEPYAMVSPHALDSVKKEIC